jgi:inward rectifier potassium channel
LLNRDGTLNVHYPKRVISLDDLYYDVIKLKWPGLLLLLFLTFLLINILFGTVFFLLPVKDFDGYQTTSGVLSHWLESFFFSVQTFGTIGYGKIAPTGTLANFIVTLESFFGLLFTAISTGLVYHRFSKPTAKVLYSDVAVIQKFDETPWILFRIVNERANSLSDVHFKASLVIQDPHHHYKSLYDLGLEHDSTPIFSLSFTLSHEINSNSPLFGLSLQEMEDRQAEIFISVTGVDPVFHQPVFSKFSYLPSEILMDHTFVDIFEESTSKKAYGKLSVDISKISAVEKIKP